MNFRKRIYVCILAVLLIFPFAASAAQGGSKVSSAAVLSMLYNDGAEPLCGAEFNIYLIAEKTDSGALKLSEQFEKYGVLISESESDSHSAAATLEGYVLRDKPTPSATGATDGSGCLRFDARRLNLKAGLYLVIGQRHVQGGMVYDAQPFTVMLSQDGDGMDEIAVEVKFSVFGVGDEGSTVSLRALKVWKDGAAQQSRPEAVTVQLLKDGSVCKTAVLNKENGWHCKWNGLPSANRWNVTELTPDGYYASVEREGDTFIVTNTLVESEMKPSEAPTVSDSPSLPQAGILWWPVPVLAVSGVMLLIFGILSEKNERHD